MHAANANPFFRFTPRLPRSVVEAGYRHEVVDLGAAALSFVRGPRSDRPALVLVPAQMGTWSSYAGVLPALAQGFEVFVVEVRGHGGSSWTPGDYCWDTVAGDVALFVERVVGRPAIISGNSSGGLIALWCAARAPAWTRAIVLEDAPVFSAEMPRFRDRDRYVFNGLARIVQTLGDVEHRRLADYFLGVSMPVSERRVKSLPAWFVRHLQRRLDVWAKAHPGEPAGLDGWWLPATLSDLFRSLSMFDPDFARAFVDGRFYGDFDHAEALRCTSCPVLLLHGTWRRFARWGLVGALDDDDVRRVIELAPQTRCVKIAANHVLHRYRPRAFVGALHELAETLSGSPHR